MVPDSLQRAYLDAGSQVLWENGEPRLRRAWLLDDDNGKRRAAGAPSRRFRTVVLYPLCLAVALPLLICASENAAGAMPEQSQPPTTKQRAKPGVLEEV